MIVCWQQIVRSLCSGCAGPILWRKIKKPPGSSDKRGTEKRTPDWILRKDIWGRWPMWYFGEWEEGALGRGWTGRVHDCSVETAPDPNHLYAMEQWLLPKARGCCMGMNQETWFLLLSLITFTVTSGKPLSFSVSLSHSHFSYRILVGT